MSTATMHLDIVTPTAKVFAGDVRMVIARGSEGELGILPHHMPLVTALKDGVVRIQREGKPELHVGVDGGFLIVRRDGVTVLTDHVQLPDDMPDA